MATPLKRWSLSVACTLGLGLSAHLALLKYFSLPCIGAGGCHSIIHSGFGAVFGIPVGVFGALLWAAALLVGERSKRAGLLLLLALGSAVFMGLQFFVLRGFCLYCTAHAVFAWIAFALNKESPHRPALALGLLLAFGGFAVARQQAEARASAAPLVAHAETPLSAAPAGVPWLGPLTPRSPAVVLSLSCAACLDLLDELTRTPLSDVKTGPAVYFKTTDDNRELTTLFVASILANPAPKQEAFLTSTALLLTVKEQALSAPALAAVQLASLMPAAESQRVAAERLLQHQADTLAAAQIAEATPLLVPTGAKPRAFFRADDLFGR